jgi:hypothetical protein
MAEMTRNGHAACFGRMFVLSVTAFRDNQSPAIGFDKFDNITNFHIQILAYIAFFDDAGTHQGGEASVL